MCFDKVLIIDSIHKGQSSVSGTQLECIKGSSPHIPSLAKKQEMLRVVLPEAGKHCWNNYWPLGLSLSLNTEEKTL